MIKKYFKKFFNEPLEDKKPIETSKVEKKGKTVDKMLQKMRDDRRPEVELYANYERIANQNKDAFLG